MTRSSAPRPAAPRAPHLVAAPAASRTAPLLLAGLLLTSACGTATQEGAGPAAATADRLAAGQQAQHTNGHVHSEGSAAVEAVAASTTAPPAPGAAPEQAADPAVALRSELERLLGAHVLLADEVVRGQLLGRDDVARASSASVGRNTDELVEAVTSLAGAPTGQQFRTTWEGHVEVLTQYATALEKDDKAGQQAARDAYGKAEAELATALSAVVGGKVPQADLTAATTAHGRHLLEQADAYAAKDYPKAASIQRDAFAHMIVMADVLARGVAAAKGLPTTELDTPRRDLHSALSRLLAEHMGLMVQVLRATQDEAPDLAAAGEALNANTADIGAAIGTLFGADASRQFLELWAAHIEGLIDVARNADDPAAQQAGREAQQQYAPQLARFLATATEERLPAIDLAAALTVHDDHLLDMVDAYAAEDYEESQQQADAGYAHMMELAGVLAVAIGQTQAAKLPQGGAATGGGGTAGRP